MTVVRLPPTNIPNSNNTIIFIVDALNTLLEVDIYLYTMRVQHNIIGMFFCISLTASSFMRVALQQIPRDVFLKKSEMLTTDEGEFDLYKSSSEVLSAKTR